tara:strand:- start:22 stop:630 length:609 start_codon:yes stop_codon:yes gene_type:complete
MKKIIHRGAEAVLYLQDGKLVKERISKGYRHKDIDFMKRKYPTRTEYRLIVRAKKAGVNVPEVYFVDDVEMKVEMEYIKGELLKDVLDKDFKKICFKIGESVALLHNNNIIHGDLTTSNMILKSGEVFFIDFGLGFFSMKDEDKAVDLKLLRQALESKHYKIFEKAFENVLNGYLSKGTLSVVERLSVVEKRGRYKRKGGAK